MCTIKIAVFTFLALATAASARWSCPRYKVRVIRAVSPNAQGLERAVNKFKALLGGQANSAQTGPLKDGFRVINWDGGAPFDMPFDFFNTNAPLGALFFAKGNKFAISNPMGEPVDDKFDSINARAAKNFIVFSKERLFTPVKGNILVTKFRVPGKNIPAAVSGFGAVYVDVRRWRTSFLDLRDARGCRIIRVYVPPKRKGLSFVGVRVKSVQYRKHGKWYKANAPAPVYKATMKLGNTPISSKRYYSKTDIVVTDDFIYGEPQKLSKKKGLRY